MDMDNGVAIVGVGMEVDFMVMEKYSKNQNNNIVLGKK